MSLTLQHAHFAEPFYLLSNPCRRKAAELAGSNKHKSKAKATAIAAPAAIAPGSSSAAFSGPPPAAAAASDAAKFQKVPKANKGKKAKPGKGQKVDNNMLGFQNKMDFNVLQGANNCE